MRRLSIVIVGVVLALAGQGCVERQLVISTTPDGVELFVDGREVGTTIAGEPVAAPFDAYGTHTVVARKRGHVPVRCQVTVDPPWWQWFPLDFFTDVLWPGTVHDTHELTLTLSPRADPADADALERRARHLAEHEGRRP
jgi:hypothetical protein